MSGKTYNTGVTREAILDAADRLTRQQGLEAWSTRQLLVEVPTSFSVVYRVVGDRQALSDAVVDSVVGTMRCPDGDLPWRDWLTELLLALRVRLVGYPGVANWLLMRGGTVPSVVPILGTGLEVLERAGFGEEAAAAYTFAFTSTVMLIAMSDARAPAVGASSTLSHAAMHDRLDAMPDPEERIPAMRAFVRELGGSEADQALQAHYEYTLERALDGLERRLESLPAGRS